MVTAANQIERQGMNAPAPRLLPRPRPLPGFDGIALFLDLDGTLAAIEPRPEDVGPQAWRTDLLRRLGERLDGRMAVISGRSLEEVDRILEGAVIAVAAVHGLVRRRSDGIIEQSSPDPALGAARERFQTLCADFPGLTLEDKDLSLSVHYRQAPELAETVHKTAEAICAGTGLKLQLGHMVDEVRSPGLDKGGAVRAFMREAPFKGAVPVFVGDDLTDEDGFRAARALGGVSILVGVARATAADMRLEDVAAVRGWLEAALARDQVT